MELHKVDAQVLDRDDPVGRDGAVLLDEPGEEASDEVLDGLIGARTALAEGDAVGEGGAGGDEALGMSGYDNGVGGSSLHG